MFTPWYSVILKTRLANQSLHPVLVIDPGVYNLIPSQPEPVISMGVVGQCSVTDARDRQACRKMIYFWSSRTV